MNLLTNWFVFLINMMEADLSYLILTKLFKINLSDKKYMEITTNDMTPI